MLVHQCGNRVGQQLVQKVAMGRPKVAEQMIIDANIAADPHIRQVPLRQSMQMTSTADGFNRGKHPQRHQDLRIDSITADSSFNGLNFLLQQA